MTKLYTERQKQRIKEQLELGNLNGAMCTDLQVGSSGNDKEDIFQPEDNPTRFKAEAEKEFTRGPSNCYLVLGKDRMGDVYSGFGGRGTPNSNSIDLVAGMASSFETSEKKFLTKDDVVDPNPFTDAARVYISQRTDLDTSFGITEGKMYRLDKKQGVSGIAAKADMVLILGRRNVKIKAGQSHGEGLPRQGETDAHGTTLPDARIELIADAPLEPMVKGHKLVECLKGIYEEIQENRLQVMKLTSQMIKLQSALARHTHVSAGGVAYPSPGLIARTMSEMPDLLNDLVENITNLYSQTVVEVNTLDYPNKDKYILSKNVFTS
jgi:hypothetical protein